MATYVSTTVFDDGTPVVEAVRRLQSIGLNNIELGSTHNYEQDILTGLKISGATFVTHNFFPPTADRLIINIASENAQIRKKSVAFMKNAIDFAEQLGAKVYTIHPGFLADPIGEGRSEKSYDFKFAEIKSELTKRYEEHLNFFFESLDELAEYVKNCPVKIALETQGSVTKKEYVLFSKPDDFESFFRRQYHSGIGFNLNLAHTALASKVWGFNLMQTLNRLLPNTLAIEVSHTDLHYDDHKALVPGGWYLDVLRRLTISPDIPLIFEARNVSLDEVKRSYALLDELKV